MIRLCDAGRISVTSSFTLDTDGTVKKEKKRLPAAGRLRVASNMGAPAWFVGDLVTDKLQIHDWNSSGICARITFPGKRYKAKYAAVVCDVPLMFSRLADNDVRVITSHSSVNIWSEEVCRRRTPSAIVDRTGGRIYIEGVGDDGIRPVGEIMPSGWCLPGVSTVARLYAATENLLVCNTIMMNSMQIWDTRADDGRHITKISRSARMISADYSRYTFVSEYLLTTCYDTAMGDSQHDIAACIYDLRNMDHYDIDAHANNVTLYNTYAFAWTGPA